MIKRNVRASAGPTSDLYDFLEDLKSYDGRSASSAKKALLHLTWMCDTYEDALKDELRRAEGLKLVTDLWKTCNNPELKAVAVLCLASAVNNNVESQEELYRKEVFGLLLRTLSSADALPKIKHVNVCLIMSLASQNETGQSLCRTSGCYGALLKMFTVTFPHCHHPSSTANAVSDRHVSDTGIEWLNQVDGGSRELWSCVVTAICAIIYYPQNEENQLLAVQVLPHALGFLNGSTDVEIVRRLTLFITYVITNNATNKANAFGVRGFKSLMSSLTSVVNSNITQRVQLAVCHVRVINTFIDDNEAGVELCAECNIVPLLVHLLSEFNLEQSDQLQIVLALSHCVTNNTVNQEKLADSDGVAVLARLISVTNDAELTSVIKYILQICLNLDARKKKENKENSSSWRFDPKSRFISTMESFLDKLKLMTKTTSDVKESPETTMGPNQSSVKKRLAPSNSSQVPVIAATFSHSTSASPDSGSVSRDSGFPRVSESARTNCRQLVTRPTLNTEAVKTKSIDAKPTPSVGATCAVKRRLSCTSRAEPSDTVDASSLQARTIGVSPTVRNVKLDRIDIVKSNVVCTESGSMKSSLEPAKKSSAPLRLSSPNRNDASVFKKPAHIPEKVKIADASTRSQGSRSVNRAFNNNPPSVYQSPLSHRAPASDRSFYRVPSSASSAVSKLDREQTPETRKKNADLPPTKSVQIRPGTSQFNCVRPPGRVTGTMEKVKSWLISTSDNFRLDDNDDNTRNEEQDFDEERLNNILLAKKCLRESIVKDTRCKPHDNSSCPGCQVPAAIVDKPILNSLTYNIAIETNSFTCRHHRAVRQAERLLASKARRSMGTSRRLLRDRLVADDVAATAGRPGCSPSEQDVYEFEREARKQTGSAFQKKRISPPSKCSVKDDESRSEFYGSCVSRSSSCVRRQRTPYTTQEIANLQHGVRTHGKFWTDILCTYEFHSRRTAVDLKDKYRQLTKTERQKDSFTSPLSESRTHSNPRPFSMAEDRRLRRGVKMFGYNWKAILSSMRFAEDRTAEQLRNKWRTLHGN